MIKICKNCNEEADINGKYCEYCGNVLYKRNITMKILAIILLGIVIVSMVCLYVYNN